MVNLQSNNSFLSDLAKFVEKEEEALKKNPDKKDGSLITKKVLKVLQELGKHRDEYLSDKLNLAKMQVDVKMIKDCLLGIIGAENLNTLSESTIWKEKDKAEGLPETLRQGLASMISLLTVRKYSPYYHGELLSKGIEEIKKNKQHNLQEIVRGYCETLLKEAHKKDQKPHYLLRDPSSLTNDEQGYELLTLSFITRDGTVDHHTLTYSEEKKFWIHNRTQTYSESIDSLIDSVIKGAEGISPSVERAEGYFSSYY